MNITRNIEKEKELYDTIRMSLNRGDDRSQEIHVSDLCHPLKAYWSKKFPKGITENEVGYFFSGNSFENLYGQHGFDEDIIHKKQGKWEGISYEIDFFHTDTNHVIETKSSRLAWRYGNKDKGIKPCIIDDCTDEELSVLFDSYIDQVSMYMAIENSNTAYIHVFFLNMVIEAGKNIAFGKKKPRFRCYELNMNNSELEYTRGKMRLKRDQLKQALNDENWQQLDKCPEWQCTECKWALSQCPTAFNSEDI